ncbi:MAG: hypothetical protein ACK4NM_19125, partial [Hydrogenophaga sp.]
RPGTGERCETRGRFSNQLLARCAGVTRCARVLIVNSVDVVGDVILGRHFDDLDGALAAGFRQYGGGFQVVPGSACGAGASLFVERTGREEVLFSGAQVRFDDPAVLSQGLRMSAWAKSEDVRVQPGAERPEFAVYIDVEYDDGTFDWGVKSQFRAGTHEWGYREAVFMPQPGKRAVGAYAYLIMRSVIGKAWFSCVQFRNTHNNLLLNPSFGERRNVHG